MFDSFLMGKQRPELETVVFPSSHPSPAYAVMKLELEMAVLIWPMSLDAFVLFFCLKALRYISNFCLSDKSRRLVPSQPKIFFFGLDSDKSQEGLTDSRMYEFVRGTQTGTF